MSINNARPRNINLGAKDDSIIPSEAKPIVISTHTPLCFGFTSGGPEDVQIIDGGRLGAMYGLDSFDRTKPYFMHTLRTAEIATGAGNTVLFKRIIPTDNDTIANVTLYLDVLEDDVDVYKRNIDGSIALDSDGNKIVDKTVTGYRLKLISEVNDDDVTTALGIKESKEGYMSDADDNKSTMYPITEFRASYKGGSYNNYGFTITVPAPSDVKNSVKVNNDSFPFEIGIVKRDNVNSTGTFIANTSNALFDQFTFKPNAVDGITQQDVTIGGVIGKWSSLELGKPLIYPVLDTPYVYTDTLKTILDNIMTAEKEYVNADVECEDGTVINTSQWLDFLPDIPAEEQQWMLNPLNARSTTNVPAFTYYIDETDATVADNQQELYLSKNMPIYLGRGKDGTLSPEELEKGISTYMENYANPNSLVMNTATNIENVIYDSGLTVDCKKSLVNFITVRKDTFLALATYEFGTLPKTVDEHRAIGATLKATLALAPESTFFGTGVTRAIIIAGSGIDKRDPARARYPLTLDIADKAALMMGGTTWNANLMFDEGGKNIIKNYTDVEPKTVSELVQDDLWSLGIIWPEPYDTESMFFSNLQSVYDVERSAMNNFFMSIALTIDNKVADAVWRKHSGNTTLKPNAFVKMVEKDYNEMIDVFDGVIDASAKVSITDFDATTGYTWTAVSNLAGNVMKTVQQHYTSVTLKSDA